MPGYIEREITQPVDLCLPGGKLNPDAIGWSRQPLHRCNLQGRWFSKKRWSYWAVTTEKNLFAISIFNRDYFGGVGIHLADFVSNWSSGILVRTAFGTGLHMPDIVMATTSFHHPKITAVQRHTANQVVISVDAKDFEGEPLEAELTIIYPENHETLSVVIPWNDRTFQYTSKHNTLPAGGFVRLGKREMHFEGPQCFGCHDYGRGIWPRRFIWNWGAGSACQDGRYIGLNLGAKWTDGTGMNENGICVDGKVTKVSEDLVWKYDTSDYMKPWQITAPVTGRVHLDFAPAHERTGEQHMGPTYFIPHQVFGRYNGFVVTEAGERVEVHDLFGWAEEVHGLW